MKEFEDIAIQLSHGESPVLKRTHKGVTYYRKFVPQDRLILLGGGTIALPLSKMADMLGFDVVVADDRVSFANKERFPMAKEVLCGSFTQAISALRIRKSDYVCVITRGHKCDKECLQMLLQGEEPGYLGLIGSRRRVHGLFDLLKANGYDAQRIDRIHSPIGLSIGAVTPEEIAVSICAELIQERRKLSQDGEDQFLLQKNTVPAMVEFLAGPERKKAMLMVLDSQGSTPVKSGAIMAIDALGKPYGTIGGGCGEAEAIQRALQLIGTGRSEIIELNMTNDVASEDGMVCGGIQHVLIEDITGPIETKEDKCESV